MTGGWVDRHGLPRGPHGRALCRWCSLEVHPRPFTFCSEFCVHEWKLRSQPAYLREQVFLRDKGVCAGCGIDTAKEFRALRYARGVRRRQLTARWGLGKRIRKSLWDADHILPVAEGGGECDLNNLRTLCLLCHKDATRQLRIRLQRQRPSPAAESSNSYPNPTCGGLSHRRIVTVVMWLPEDNCTKGATLLITLMRCPRYAQSA